MTQLVILRGGAYDGRVLTLPDGRDTWVMPRRRDMAMVGPFDGAVSAPAAPVTYRRAYPRRGELVTSAAVPAGTPVRSIAQDIAHVFEAEA